MEKGRSQRPRPFPNRNPVKLNALLFASCIYYLKTNALRIDAKFC